MSCRRSGVAQRTPGATLSISAIRRWVTLIWDIWEVAIGLFCCVDEYVQGQVHMTYVLVLVAPPPPPPVYPNFLGWVDLDL